MWVYRSLWSHEPGPIRMGREDFPGSSVILAMVPHESSAGAAFKKKIVSVALWAGEWSAGQGGGVPAGAGAGGCAGGEAGIAASGH